MRFKSTNSIRFRLTLVLSILLLPLVAYMVLVGWSRAEEQALRARETVRYLAETTSKYERGLFGGTERLFKGLIQQPELRAGGDACDDDLRRLRATMSEYRSLSVLDGAGNVVCSSLPALKGTSVADRDYFRQALLGDRLVIGTDFSGPQQQPSREPITVAALPWRNPDASLAGVIAADIDLARLRATASDLALPPDSRFYLFDSHGTQLAGHPDLPPYLKDQAHLSMVLNGRDDLFDAVGADGIERTFAATSIQGGDVTAIFGIPVRSVAVVDTADRAITVMGPIVLWLIAVATVWFAADLQIGRPVRRLARVAGAYSFGDPAARPPQGGPTELRTLAETFGQMARRIADREIELREAIATREAMLREIHHRVKNNLQIVTSLLNIQGKSVQGDSAKRAFGEIQTRVRALALVHRYLYESDDLKSVNLGAFLKELAASLQLSYGISEEQVTIEVEADQVWDVSDRAVPLALFMTEAMTNALKHAFPQGRRGMIRVVLKALQGGVVRFSVEDNGVGLTEAQLAAQGRQASLGMSLIKAFARQVDGKLTISGPPGTVVAIEFLNKFRAPEFAPEKTTLRETA